jgi:glycosyltransferase involved in cell wall biosynthesis
MVSISIIICTHNPDRAVFSRCLQAVSQLDCGNEIESEIIIVDNNSQPPVADIDYVKEFLSRYKHRRLVQESKPGLTYARLAGFYQSKGQAIVFFDDDNLPQPDYLAKVVRLLDRYPQVAVWGPGIVEVVWEDGVSDWTRSFAGVFQERKRQHTEFGLVVGWPHFFPPGTGMVVGRTVLERYAEQVERGQLSAEDRCGKRMTSGGDGQIVWSAVKMGLCAGISPDLGLRHFIARRKANLGYICRMIFGVMASGQIALVESFPGEKEKIGGSLPSTTKFYALVVLEIFKTILLFRVRRGSVHLVGQLGEFYGKNLAINRRPPLISRLVAKWLGYS